MAKGCDKSQLKCSFCGKTQDKVKKLVAGPGVYICEECIELCAEIVEDEYSDIVMDEEVEEIDPEEELKRRNHHLRHMLRHTIELALT